MRKNQSPLSPQLSPSPSKHTSTIGNHLIFGVIQTLPVLFGYIFLGLAFGLLLQKAGYSYVWALFISSIVYAGSMQFVLIGILGSDMSIFSILLLTLSINSRHIFYGLSFIDPFKKMGKLYPYMIFSLTDETYSLLCRVRVPEHLNQKQVYFTISLLNQCYWVMGSIIGAVAGEMIKFNSTGIDFAMTALFVVIFIEQWRSAKNHLPAIIGVICGITSLIVFGPNGFILPAMVVAITILMLCKKFIQVEGETA